MRKGIIAMAVAALIANDSRARSRDPGPPNQRQVTLGGFDRIAVAGPFLVRVHTGKDTSVSLSGPRTMLEDTELFVRDGELTIRWQEGASWSRNGDRGVDIDITMPVIRGATNAGAGEIEIDSVQADRFAAMLLSAGTVTIQSMDVGHLNAQLAGSGNFAVGRIAADDMVVDLAGSGGVQAKGRAGNVSLRIMGSGSFDNPDFSARDAHIVSSSSGVLRATVTHKADIQSMGSGDIALTGGAKCRVSKAGSGNVRCS